MRLDHLLSKEDEVGIVLLFRGQCLLEQGSYVATKFERTYAVCFCSKLENTSLRTKCITKWTGNDVHTRFACEASLSSVHNQAVSMRLWGTPVPIPNTMVKTQTADGTLLETARKSRWMPLL